MFTPHNRLLVKEALIDRAHVDERVVGAALLGSSAAGEEDRWSDIDLALSVDGDQIDAAIEDWTGVMYDTHGAVHHFDLRFETTLYRVFLLESTLQVDLSFWASDEFISVGPRLRLLFGEPPLLQVPEERPGEAIIGEAWLYLLHARSSLARARYWQANHMIAGVRDRVLELACRRHDLRTDDARCVDDLPVALLDDYASMIPHALGERELREAVGTTTKGLIDEARQIQPDLAEHIRGTLEEIGTVAA